MPQYEVDLRSYFTPRSIARSIEKMPSLKTPVIDLIYKKRPQHPFPVLGVDELSKVLKNMPVVRRGTAAIPVIAGTKGMTYIEPQPVELSAFLSAVELNNLKLLDNKGVQSFVNGKIDYLRLTSRKTTEALASQTLTGTISYAMKIEGGFDTYTVNFGSINSVTITTKWENAGKTIGDILNDLITISDSITSNGWSDVVFLAGKTAYINLANKVTALGNDARINATVTETGISVAGFTVRLFNHTYTDPTDDSTVNVIDPKKVVAVGLSAPFTLYYCSIDDVDAGLLPMPFYANAYRMKNPSGYDIVSRSKPFPVPVLNAITEAQVIT